MDKLQKIAEQVGVSPNTVLRVLRGQNKEVWGSAIRRGNVIRDLAQEMGYMPNGSARAMRQGRFNAVTLLLSTDRGRSNLPSDLFDRIHDDLAARDIRLIVSKLPDEKLTNSRIVPAILRECSCDGLLINYTDHIPQAMISLIGRYRIPSIWLNSRQAADCVYYDDFGGAMTATQKLLSQGHRRIAYLDFAKHDSTTHYSRVDRYQGYLQAMRVAGVAPSLREPLIGIPVCDRLETTRRLLSSPERPTAILSYDASERALYAAALAGLRVPADLSLITFSDAPSDGASHGETFVGRTLTRMWVPAERAGHQAVELLLQKITAPKQVLQPCVVPLILQEGDTCAPPANL